MKKVALGRGLDALIPSAPAADTTPRYPTVAIDEIAPNPMQPRQQFDGEQLQQLAVSIKEHGMLQPLVVRRNGSGYTIVAGERRYRAARLAGLQEVPVMVLDDVDDTRTLELALVENIHRADLNPMELAEAYRRLLDQCGLTQQQLADRLGRSRAAIANSLRLLSLPRRIQDWLRQGRLTEGHARTLLSLSSESAMLQTAEKMVEGGWTVRQAEQHTRTTRKRRLVPRRRDPAVAEMENELKRLLGTAVRIVPGLKRGRIEIEYYGDEDLDRLWSLFRRMAER